MFSKLPIFNSIKDNFYEIKIDNTNLSIENSHETLSSTPLPPKDSVSKSPPPKGPPPKGPPPKGPPPKGPPPKGPLPFPKSPSPSKLPQPPSSWLG